jgi:hypothetical protein
VVNRQSIVASDRARDSHQTPWREDAMNHDSSEPAAITKEQAAIHEAGHLALSIICGALLGETKIYQHDADWLGDHESCQQYGSAVGADALALVIAGCFAGTVAERIAEYAPAVERTAAGITAELRNLGENPSQRWSHNFLQANRLARRSRPNATGQEIKSVLIWGWMRADEVLREHWSAVEALAEGILRSDAHVLSGEEARAIVAAHGLAGPVRQDCETRARATSKERHSPAEQ